MRLTEIAPEEFSKFYKRPKLYNILCQFRDSDMSVAKVDGAHYANAKSGVGSFNALSSAINLSAFTH